MNSRNRVRNTPQLPMKIMMSTAVGWNMFHSPGRKARCRLVTMITNRSNHMPTVTAIETMLAKVVAYEKLNYLMLMMVDPDVHFHVIPRYSSERVHEGTTFPDAGWPGPPNLAAAVDLGADGAERLAAFLRANWPAA